MGDACVWFRFSWLPSWLAWLAGWRCACGHGWLLGWLATFDFRCIWLFSMFNLRLIWLDGWLACYFRFWIDHVVMAGCFDGWLFSVFDLSVCFRFSICDFRFSIDLASWLAGLLFSIFDWQACWLARGKDLRQHGPGRVTCTLWS